MTDYSIYELSRKEMRDYYTVSLIALGFGGYLFYHSIIASVLLCLLSFPLKRLYAGYLRQRRLDELLEGFRDFLYSLSASIAAGRQMPQAVEAAASELGAAWGEDSDIAAEILHISVLGRSAHADTADLLHGLAERSGLEDIASFASACQVCRKTGGDLESVCVKSASLLLDKIDFRESTRALIAEKKLDLIILGLMPPGILFFLNISSLEYIEALYTTAGGRFMMTASLLLMGLALFAGMKITDISV